MKKNIIKKFSIIVSMVFVITFFAGCAEGGYSINVFENGSILETFYIELDKDIIINAGYDYNDVENEVINSFQSVRNGMVSEFINRDDGLTIFSKNKILQGIRTPSIENSVIGISFLFENYEAYKMFYGIQEANESEPDNEVVEDKIFYVQTTTTGKTAFYGTQQSDLVNSLLAYFSNPQNGDQIFNFTNVNLTYTYATSSSKLRSNADNIFYDNNGLKVHEWNIPQNNYDMQIEFYDVKIISTWWYVLALALTVLVVIGITIAYNIDAYKSKLVKTITNNDDK